MVNKSIRWFFISLICILSIVLMTSAVKVFALDQVDIRGAFARAIIDKFDSLNPVPAAAPISIAEPTQTISPATTIVPKKSSYKIAVFGDSMVDTMGERLEYLEHALKRKYPDTIFNLYNYGKGAQNVEEGLSRFNTDFIYSTRHYIAVTELKPDIFIVGSFAYNPFWPYDRDKHWLLLTQLVQQAKSTNADVYILAEIAPLRSDFGRGPNGVNWASDTSYEHSGWIIELLQNAVGIGRALNVPVIDLFDKTYNPETHAGERKYVNPSDGIHPSIEGHEFTADQIVENLKL